jgi:hypothetical protein
MSSPHYIKEANMAKVKALLMDIENLYVQRQNIQAQVDELREEQRDIEAKLLALVIHDPHMVRQFVKLNYDKLGSALFGEAKPYNHFPPAEKESKDVS